MNGFVYYIQVNARGFAIATKTNTAYYGPIHACYGDNAKAVAAIPKSGCPINCTPIELVTGYDDASTSCSSLGVVTHGWQVARTACVGTGYGIINYYPSTPFGRFQPRNKILDSIGAVGFTGQPSLTLYGSNLFSGSDSTGNDFQVHRVGVVGENVSASFYGKVAVPCLDITDWYKFCGTATDEALMLVSDTVTYTSATGTNLAAATTINVASTSGFQSAGYIIIETEIIQYTGITSTSFTGCTRAKYATTAADHFDGDAVSQGLWFTKINGGALFCGYTKPS